MIPAAVRTAGLSVAVVLCAASHVVSPPAAYAAQGRESQNPVTLANDGAAALEDRRYGDALDAFTRASALLPKDPSLRMGAGVAAFMLGRLADARTWFEGALAVNPRYTAASSYLGEVFYREGSVSDAIAVYEAALKFASGDDRAELEKRLAEWRKDSALHDRFYQARGAHFAVLFEGPADETLARRVVEILESAYWRIGNALNTYPAQPVTVVLYTREQFRDVTQTPDWVAGMYDGRIRIPVRGALDHPIDLERILTHEYVHAVVASIGGRAAPAWLNEGLAEYFEADGLEAADRQLAADTTRVSWDRLERGFSGLSSADASAAYAQSAVAVRKMIDLRGAPAVVSLVQALGRGAAFEAAFQGAIFLRFDEFTAMMMRQ
jgi:tetratricopeptide (TPR) repeat protein